MTKLESTQPLTTHEQVPAEPSTLSKEISPAVRSWITNVIAPALVKSYLEEQARKAKLPEVKARMTKKRKRGLEKYANRRKKVTIKSEPEISLNTRVEGWKVVLG